MIGYLIITAVTSLLVGLAIGYAILAFVIFKEWGKR